MALCAAKVAELAFSAKIVKKLTSPTIEVFFIMPRLILQSCACGGIFASDKRKHLAKLQAFLKRAIVHPGHFHGHVPKLQKTRHWDQRVPVKAGSMPGMGSFP
jgi:hypothetical protein